MLVGCVSFHWHPGSPFFSHRRCMLLSRLRVCVLSFRHHSLSLSLQKLGHSCSDNNTRSLSIQKVTRSICVLRCPCRPDPFAAASYVRSEDCATAKGARADVDRAVLCASDPPPRPRSACVESPRQGGN
jgi:hypothetical protein